MATFADIKTPEINELTLKRVLSATVKENIFQGVVVKPDEGVTEKYSEDTDASEIQVIRVKPNQNDARELGSDTNGGWFNSQSASQPTTEAYGIQIIQTIDRNIDIPANAQGMINVDLAAKEAENLAGLVNRNINAGSIAAMLAKNFNNVAGYDKKNSNASAASITAVDSNWITHDSQSYVNDIFDALAKLDDGNASQGIDAYPDENRAIYVRASIKAQLLKNMTGLYGGTAVVSIANNGSLVPSETTKVATTGYIGKLGNVPVYLVAGVTWNLAEKYLGLPKGALDQVACVVVSSIGTGRALAFNSAIKQIASPDGQGVRIQPKYRFGVECWDALSVVPVFSSSFTNPVAGTSSTLFLRGVGSRAAVATPTESSFTSNTIKVATTTDDAAIYYTLDGTIPSVGNGTLYTSAGVTISANKTFKAVAFKNGTYSEVYSKAYTYSA